MERARHGSAVPEGLGEVKGVGVQRAVGLPTGEKTSWDKWLPNPGEKCSPVEACDVSLWSLVY